MLDSEELLFNEGYIQNYGAKKVLKARTELGETAPNLHQQLLPI